MVGLGQAKTADSEAIEDAAERIVRDGVRVPLWHDDDGLAGSAMLLSLLFLLSTRRKPTSVDVIILWMRRPESGGETKKLSGFQLTARSFALERCVLCDGAWTNVGGKEQRMPHFKPKIARGFIAEVFDRVLCDAPTKCNHSVLIGGFGSGFRWSDPVKAPLERTDDAVGIAARQFCFPAVHPLRVKLREHTRSLPTGRGACDVRILGECKANTQQMHALGSKSLKFSPKITRKLL